MPETRPWTRVAVLAGTTALLGTGAIVGAGPASAESEVPRPTTFTSAYTVAATPDGVFDAEGEWVPGEQGAQGIFNLQVNSKLDVICWEMSLTGVEGDFESATKTGVTIHEAPAGWNGPARLSVPEPVQDGASRTGSGCAEGPFTTGVDGEDGRDSGTWFSLADLEADPASYSVDVRTADFPDGAVRGQLSPVPVGGLDTGFGGLATADGPTRSWGAGLVAVAVAGFGGVMTWRRGRTA